MSQSCPAPGRGLQHEIDEARGIAWVRGTGQLSMPEMVQAVDTVVDDPHFRPDLPLIFDLRNARYEAELADGEVFVAALKRRMDNFHSLFILLVPPELHALARIYAVLAKVGGFDRMRCCLDIDEAIGFCTGTAS